MNEIVIENNKILSLKNVLCQNYQITNKNEINHFITSYTTYLNKNNIETFGPLIISIKEIKEGLELKIMAQCKFIADTININKEYKSKRCIYTRFCGKFENVKYAKQKIDIYAYENNILLDGEEYMVILGNENGNVVIDIFKQILDL